MKTMKTYRIWSDVTKSFLKINKTYEIKKI